MAKLVNCIYCAKEIDLDSKSWDAAASSRCCDAVCVDCENKLWTRAEEEAERADKEIKAKLEALSYEKASPTRPLDSILADIEALEALL